MSARDDERLTRLESKMDSASKLFQDAYGRLDEIASRQAATNDRLDLLRKETNERADRTNERLDRLIEVTTRSYTDWAGRNAGRDARVTALEDRVDRLEE